jgi:type I restriction enzyme S subunit
VTLDNLAKNRDSMRKPVTSGLREAGNIPYYGASGIVDYVKDYIFDGDFLLISEDGANLVAEIHR